MIFFAPLRRALTSARISTPHARRNNRGIPLELSLALRRHNPAEPLDSKSRCQCIPKAGVVCASLGPEVATPRSETDGTEARTTRLPREI